MTKREAIEQARSNREWIAMVIHLNRQLRRALACLKRERAKRPCARKPSR